MTELTKIQEIWIIYDGECPLCTFASKRIKLQKVGKLHLLNAREAHPLNQILQNKGLDYNQGFIVKIGENLYQGAQAMHVLALLSTNTDWFNKINAMIFRYQPISKLIYPVLKGIRAILLWARSK
ncbi:MAG: DUF393 domain-containing protein [Proteobacteria bacterium]|nr:DUF393 domain-containing protein [Pseudomonadota bacterium]